MVATRGPQVLLEGYARDVARGGGGKTMRDNIQAMDALQSAGLVADGNTVDGTSRTGGKAYDPVVAQFPHAPVPAWEVPAPLLSVDISSSQVTATSVTATSGMFGGVANPGMRAGGAALTWVGQSDSNWMSYYDTQSLSAFYPSSTSALGVVAAVRASDRLVGPNSASIAYAAYATSDSTDTNAGFVWGYYGSTRRIAGGHIAVGMELSSGNLGTAVELNPYNAAPQGSTIGLWLSSGSEAYAAGLTVNPSSTAIGICSNGSTWDKGIVVTSNSLTADGSGRTKAIQLPSKAEMQWTFNASGARSSFIRSDATAAGGVGVLFNNTSLNVVDAATETVRFSVAASGAITSPLLTNAANDAAAASAGVAVGQFYRAGSVVMQRVA